MKTAMTLVAWYAVLTAFSLPAEAKLYKWVDDKGETHYGETIPPEYADRDNVLLSDQGRVVKKNEKSSAEELRAKKESAAKKLAEDEAAIKQRRKDRTLLSTYTSENEIDLTRDRNLQQTEAVVNSVQLLLKSAQDSLMDYQQEAGQRARAGKSMPASLKADIAASEKKIAKLQQDLTKAQEKSATVRASYEADKVRFRELAGGNTRK